MVLSVILKLVSNIRNIL